jgi:hypothetical protein
MSAYGDRCAICMKDISREIPNDWDPYLCESCAIKEHFKRRKENLPQSQKTLFESIK